jgi:hypothetical protein
MTVCHRCGTIPVPHTTVCMACCLPLDTPAPKPSAAPVAAPVPTPHASAVTQVAEGADVIASWPFGGADVSAAAQVASQVAAQAAAADAQAELDQHWTAQDTTHVVSAIPAQRLASQREAENYSVPPVGPNPFLACVEGYPV